MDTVFIKYAIQAKKTCNATEWIKCGNATMRKNLIQKRFLQH